MFGRHAVARTEQPRESCRLQRANPKSCNAAEKQRPATDKRPALARATSEVSSEKECGDKEKRARHPDSDVRDCPLRAELGERIEGSRLRWVQEPSDHSN